MATSRIANNTYAIGAYKAFVQRDKDDEKNFREWPLTPQEHLKTIQENLDQILGEHKDTKNYVR